ncbi:MAG: NAD(P)H-dependent oxidoreductase [Halanaerobiales bacterium]|nr:NAD(P)H-dependent oxidoreductase [Halanaerobiales bacterium]
MKIGIIVYSQTGNTYSVVEKVKEELTNKGHEVNINRLEPLNPNDVHPGAKNIKYKNLPELEKYDGYIFASPVQAFSLAAGMESYFDNIENLDNKKTACFLTKGLPFNWTGGTRAMKQLKELAESKNGKVVETGIIKWLSFNRKKQIRNVVKKIGQTF